jgi:hypothetical protein
MSLFAISHCIAMHLAHSEVLWLHDAIETQQKRPTMSVVMALHYDLGDHT